MNKLTIILEGASGIGKTTLCKKLQNNYKTIPEVNQLFERTNNSDNYWYLKKQIERFKIGNTSNITTIFDGDLFQPIWYNWIYNYPKEFLSAEKTHEFYKENIKNQNIQFPDLYIVFYCSEEELRRRKNSDKTRLRRNFEKHLLFIKPQIAYFEYIQKFTPINVKFIEYTDLESTYEKVKLAIEETEIKKKNDLEAFNNIETWMLKTKCNNIYN
ncbi:DEAD/DEAH box helicase family protein [Tenacibaculum amylolyticum]|uniref:hypothetical protein n=1 Tax=Tenacibaculum amylolyticum TaxID=104269 RepID=UPI003892F2EF